MNSGDPFDDDGPSLAEDARFARRLAGRDSPAERAAFAARMESDPAFRERFEAYRFIKEAFNPAVARALVPPGCACRAVRRRFDRTRLVDGVRAPLAADRPHLDACPSCALAWLVFAETGRHAGGSGLRLFGRRRPPLVGLLLAAGTCLVLVRTGCQASDAPTKTTGPARPVLVAAAETAPTVAAALEALGDPALVEAARSAADPRRPSAERRDAALRLARAGTSAAGAAAWALAAAEEDAEMRRQYYAVADLTDTIPPPMAVAAVRREMSAAEPRNLDVLLALLRRRGAAPARPVLLDLARMAVERPGAFAAETHAFDQLLFALPDDAEAAALVEAAASSSKDPRRAVFARYALAARAFAADDERGLDDAMRALAGDIASPETDVASRAALAFARFAKGRHLAAVEARGVDAFAARWKDVLRRCAERGERPTPQS